PLDLYFMPTRRSCDLAMRLALTLLASHVMESGSLEVSGADALKAMELQRQEQWAEAVAAYRRAAHQIRHPALSMNLGALLLDEQDRKSTRLNSSHVKS